MEIGLLSEATPVARSLAERFRFLGIEFRNRMLVVAAMFIATARTHLA